MLSVICLCSKSVSDLLHRANQLCKLSILIAGGTGVIVIELPCAKSVHESQRDFPRHGLRAVGHVEVGMTR